ncbi:MAG: RDD family protein [Actinobacteria bacterium]|nr:RDD family protein [Actinomycetota bacterium]
MPSTSTKIVTPEAVVLEVDAAGLASRVLAALIDVMAQAFVLNSLFFVMSIVGTSLGAGNRTAMVVVAVVVYFALIVAWPTTWEVVTRGRSLGKMALGLRVVTVEGAPIRFRHALVRGLIGFIEIQLSAGVIALLVAMGSRRFRRLGDHLAGTVVVRERMSAGLTGRAVRFQPHPAWEPWAARLDATRLAPEHYRLVRNYLLRAGDLAPEVSNRLGAEILATVFERLGVSPSAMTGALAWGPTVPLAAVAAAYQRRFDRVTADSGAPAPPRSMYAA